MNILISYTEPPDALDTQTTGEAKAPKDNGSNVDRQVPPVESLVGTSWYISSTMHGTDTISIDTYIDP